MHWATELIGRPYRARARGPEAFDCWGLCVYVWQTYYGLHDVPDVAVGPESPRYLRARFQSAVNSGEARRIQAPVDGCAVYLSRGRLPDHIGIYLTVDGGGVLHALEHTGVILTKWRHLRPDFNVLGCYVPMGM